MLDPKQKMSASYRAIFILSIFMVFFVLIAGAATKSKSSGFGMWIWGYTAWLMYKRRISDLVSFYKVILWFDAIAISVVLAVLVFRDNDIGYSLTEAIVLLGVVISITYGLYRYFFNLQNSPAEISIDENTDSSLWEQVSEEIKKGQRIDSLWTRAFSEADGDNNKANARYIKLRVDQLKNLNSQESNGKKSSIYKNTSSHNTSHIALFWGRFNLVGKIGIFGVAILIGALIYQNNTSSIDSSSISKNTPNSANTSNVPIVKDIKIDICYVYWDGVKFQLGKTEGDKFSRYVKQFYGVDRLEFALPKDTVNFIIPKGKVGDDVTDSADKFLNLHWTKIEQLCNF